LILEETKFYVDRSTGVTAALRVCGDGQIHPDPMAIVRTPTDIFPNIDIPVFSIIWNYNGLVPEDMSNRVVSVTVTSSTSNRSHCMELRFGVPDLLYRLEC
jgi:hypothetical protein